MEEICGKEKQSRVHILIESNFNVGYQPCVRTYSQCPFTALSAYTEEVLFFFPQQINMDFKIRQSQVPMLPFGKIRRISLPGFHFLIDKMQLT